MERTAEARTIDGQPVEIDLEVIRLELLAKGAFTDIDEIDEVSGAIDEMWDAYENEPGYYEGRYPFYF